MTHVHTIVEPTQTMRDWLRTLSTLTAEVDADDITANGLRAKTVYPAIVLNRVGGTIDGPVDNGLYRFDVWAEKASDSARIASVLVSLLMSTGPTDMGSKLMFKGATPQSPAYFPDPAQAGIHRQTFVAQVTTVQNL